MRCLIRIRNNAKTVGTLLLQLGDVGKKFYVDREESEDSLLLAASAAQQASVMERVCIFTCINNRCSLL